MNTPEPDSIRLAAHWNLPGGIEQVTSPGILLDLSSVDHNIEQMIEMVQADPSRLRPHVKTHKMPEAIERQVAAGITQFKAATLPEARMIAQAGGTDILLAYQPVGPNVQHWIELIQEYPRASFATIVDDETALEKLERAAERSELKLATFIDVDCGMHRTGIPLGQELNRLRDRILASRWLHYAGLHVYDGHLHDPSTDLRDQAARQIIGEIQNDLALTPSPTIVGGGSPTFATWAAAANQVPLAGNAATDIPATDIPATDIPATDIPAPATDDRSETQWQCSPGTTIFWDIGYATHYPELPFRIAAAMVTRVISKPGKDLICLDIGCKSVASEMPLSQRVWIPELGDAEFVSQSEEHLVVRTPRATQTPIGTTLLALPRHICPTIAKHTTAHIVQDGFVTGQVWHVTANR